MHTHRGVVHPSVYYTQISLSLLIPFPFPSEVGQLNPAKRSGDPCELPSGFQGRVPAEIEFGAF